MAGERPTNGDGGHWLVTESETRLLERFEGYKHSFDGSDNDGIPREIILPRLGNLDDNSRGIRKGRLIITTYVISQGKA